MENSYENKREKHQHGYDTNNPQHFHHHGCHLLPQCRGTWELLAALLVLFLVVTTHLDLVIFKVLNKFLKVEVRVKWTERVGMNKGQKEPDLILCSLGFFLDISLVVLVTTVGNFATK